jgi:transcriptional regulator with XRE-family HTH domain
VDKLKRHWTERSIASFVNRIAFDFVTQIQKRLEEQRTSKKEFARLIGVTPSRVSQVFNDPGNLQLANVVEYAKGAGLKVAIVAYDDGDPKNHNGPINSEIFEQCWKLQGGPTDFFDLANVAMQTGRISLFHETASTGEPWRSMPINAQLPLMEVAGTDTENTKKAII